MIYQQRGGMGLGVFGLLATVVFTAIGTVVGLGVAVLILFVKGVGQGVKHLRTTNKAKVTSFQAASSAPTSPVGIDAPQLEANVDDEAESQWTKRFDLSTCRHVALGKTKIEIWFYPNLGIARRKIRFANARLAKKLGKRIALSDVDLKGTTADEIEKMTLAEVQLILDEGTKTREVAVKKPVSSVLSAIAPASVADNVQLELPQPVVEKSAVTAISRSVSDKPRSSRTAVATYRGTLEKFGVEPREDKSNGGQYNCFCIHYFDFALGTTHDLVGTDLERAIREAGVGVGDSIEVSLIGDVKTPIGNGKFRRKKVWNITKLDPKP